MGILSNNTHHQKNLDNKIEDNRTFKSETCILNVCALDYFFMAMHYVLMLFDGFRDITHLLGVVGEITTRSISIAKGHSVECKRDIHHSPSLTYKEDIV